MERDEPLKVHFFTTESGNQPVRDFLMGLTKDDRIKVGGDIFLVQKAFPMGLPVCRKMESDLWEIRSDIGDGICRVFFTLWQDIIVLLHGFVKKSQKTPENELKTARKRLSEFKKLHK